MSEKERSSTADDESGVKSRRRRFLNWLAGLGIVAFVGSLAMPLKDLAVVAEEVGSDAETSNLPGQRLVFAHVHEKDPQHVHQPGNYVKADHLSAPDAALVSPEDLSQEDAFLINLHKLEEDAIEEPTNMDMTDGGFVAYSAVCTHLGCSVSWTTDEHDVGGPHDHCPCHVGEFDPYRGAEVVAGPPPKSLPQVGVTVDDEGFVALTTDFEEAVEGE